MRINLKYGRKPEAEKEMTDSELTANYIEFAANSVFRDGLKSNSQRRTFGRLQRKLDAAIEAKQDEIELAQDEKDFLKEIFITNSPAFPAYFSKFVLVLQDEIEKIFVKQEAQPETK